VARREVEWGWVAPELADELPGLAVAYRRVPARPGRTPRPLRRQLRQLADRIGGAKVVQARQDDVPWAYRVLWRKLGVDPDVDRTPFERLMLERLKRGGLRSAGLPADAATLATLETGVPVVVVDADRAVGTPGLRAARQDETLGGDAGALRTGEVVYADEQRPLARIDGELAEEREVTDATTTMLVCALVASSVSELSVEEALWIAAGALGATGRLERSDVGET
jgi:DNA/RNA-binding domain of Phe-tRNA-synthetase-like protein